MRNEEVHAQPDFRSDVNNSTTLVTHQPSKDAWTILLTIAFILLTLGIFIGNCLVVAAVVTTRRLKTITNIYVVSLAAADLLVAIFVLPASIAMYYTGKWPFEYPLICRLWIIADIVLCTASIFNLVVISFDRYMAVTKPLEYIAKRTRRSAAILLTVAWSTSFIVVLPPLVGGEPLDEKNQQCAISRNKYYRLYSSVISFYLPCILMLYLYARILCVSYHRLSQFNRAESPWFQDLKTPTEKLKLPAKNDKKPIESIKSNYIVRSNFTQSLIAKTKLSGDNRTQKPGSYESHYTKNKRLATNLRSSKKFSSKSIVPKNDRVKSPQCNNSSFDDLKPDDGQDKCSKVSSQKSSSNQPHSVMNTSLNNLSTFKLEESSSSLSASECNLSVRKRHESWNFDGNYGRKSSLFSLRKQSSTMPHSDLVSLKKNFKARNSSQRLNISGYFNRTKEENPDRVAFQLENKTAITLAYVVGCFSFCWMPFFIMYLSQAFVSFDFNNTVVTLITWLGYGNSVFNPFIYAFYNKEYSNAFRRILRMNKKKL